MDYSKCSFISWDKYYESPEIMIKEGDILFVKTGSSYGKNCFVDKIPMECTINPQLIVFKNIIGNNKWFSYLLQTNFINMQAELAVVGGTIPTMSQEKIGNFIIVIPPLQEQQEIVTYLDEKCKHIEEVISTKKKELEVLEKYKKSLIYEYVTGKKEVAKNE
jgi:type I restriction enzyme S subunit